MRKLGLVQAMNMVNTKLKEVNWLPSESLVCIEMYVDNVVLNPGSN